MLYFLITLIPFMGGASKRIQGLALILVTIMVVGTVASGAAVSEGPQTTSVIVVDDDGGQGVDYTSIQAAVDNASAGDTIQVEPGTYNETVVLNESVSLVGRPGDGAAGPAADAPILDGGGRNGSSITIATAVQNISIVGFEIRDYAGGTYSETAGIRTTATETENVVIRDNAFHDLDSLGVTVFGGPAVTHANWTIANNQLEGIGLAAINVRNVHTLAITGNEIVGSVPDGNPTGATREGILVVADDGDSSGVAVRNNSITGTLEGFGAIDIWAQADYEDGDLQSAVVSGNEIDLSSESGHNTRGINVFARGNETRGTVGTIESVRIASNDVHAVPAAAVGLGGINAENGEIRNVRIASNELNNSRNGVNIDTDGGTPNIANVTIEDNLMGQARAGSVRAENVAGITVRDNEIVGGIAATPSDYAIAIVAMHGDSSAITVAENEVTGGFEIFGGVLNLWAVGEEANSSIRSATVSGNVLDVSTSTEAPTRGINVFARGNSSIGTVGSIEDVTIQDNSVTGTNAGAIGLGGGFAETATIEHVRVASNWLRDSGRGIGLHARDQYLIRNVTFVDNRIERIDRRGINFVTSQESVLRDATLRNNSVLQINHTGIRLYPGGVSTVTDVSFLNNSIAETVNDGIKVVVRQNASARQMIIRNNSVSDSGGDSVRLNTNGVSSFSNISVEENHFEGAHDRAEVDIGAWGSSSLSNVSVTANRISGGSGDGVWVTSNSEAVATNVSVLNNDVESVGRNGIQFGAWQNSTLRSVTVSGNELRNAAGQGIRLSGDGTTARLSLATISGNQISNTSRGISLVPRGPYEITAVQIKGNTLTDIEDIGIGIHPHEGTDLTAIDVTANRVSNTGYRSIFAWGRNGSISELSIQGNDVANSDDAGISVLSRGTETIRTVSLANNSITNTDFNGLRLRAIDHGVLSGVVVRNNTLRPVHKGIVLETNNSGTVADVTLLENDVEGSNQFGLFLWNRLSDGELSDVDVSDNRFVNSSRSGVFVWGDNTSAPEIRVSGNVVSGNARFGIANFGSGLLNATDNWWGESSGPSSMDPEHPVTDPATGGVANGTGDNVSSGVRFDPWLTTDPAGPPAIVENPPTDPDGDDRYEDVNGDGSFDIVDVNALFQNYRGPTVQDNAESFDFNGDGSVNIVDVNALFQMSQS